MLIWIMFIISIAMTAVLIRLIRGKTVWDKLLSLNLFAVQTAMLIITYAVYIDAPLVMDIAITYSIVGFLSLILLTRFIVMGGKQ